MSLREDLITEARKYKGVRFRHQGRSPVEGFDCAGLIIRVANDVLPDFAFDYRTYERYPDGQTLLRLCKENMDQVSEPRLATHGDVLLMFDIDPQWPCHVAFLATDGPHDTVIHAAAMKRKVVEHRLSADWCQKIKRVFRFRGV